MFWPFFLVNFSIGFFFSFLFFSVSFLGDYVCVRGGVVIDLWVAIDGLGDDAAGRTVLYCIPCAVVQTLL